MKRLLTTAALAGFVVSCAWWAMMSAISASSASASAVVMATAEDEDGGHSEELGTWTAKCQFWMAGPDQPPIATEATEVNRKLGNWLISDFTTNFEGQPFQGHGIASYDPKTKMITGMWVDSMSPKAIHMTGTWDAATKTRTMLFDSADPMSGEPTKEKHIGVIHKNGTRTYTAYTAKGPDFKKFEKTMEFQYAKKS